MKSEPDIIKILREAEKKGQLKKLFYDLNNYNNMEFKNEEIPNIEFIKKKEGRSEDSFTKTENILLSVFDLVNDAILILDIKNGDILTVNNKTCQIYGYKKREIKNLKIENISANIPPYTHEEATKYIKEAANGKPQLFDWLSKSKTGKLFWTEMSLKKASIKDMEFIISIGRDITKRKNLEEEHKKSEEKYRNLIEQGPDPIIALDNEGIITSFNKATLNLIDLNKKQYIGKHISKLGAFFEEDIKKYFKIYESLKSGKKENILEFKIKQKNGTTSWSEGHIGIIRKGEQIIGSELMIRDNTKNRMTLNELRDAHDVLFINNKELEIKVKERTSEIRALIEQKDEFINQLSHDLKTPLTPIIILLPMIKDYLKEPKSLELIEVVNRNIYYIKDLVDKTIDLAKLNSTKIKLDINNIKLFTEVNKVIENCKVLLENNKINIENMISENINVKADRLRLEELFNNLITNSVKYSSDEGGNISINAIKKEDEVTISIKDNGKGMEKEQVKNIFEEFYKIDQSRHNLDSSGLGLTICKRIVEKHGGKIWAESEGLGKGTTFYFTLKPSENNSDVM